MTSQHLQQGMHPRARIGWLIALIACLALWPTAFAQTGGGDPAPKPRYRISYNTLDILGVFDDPKLASGYIEAEHLTWPWTNVSGTGVMYCPAHVPQTSKNEFLSQSPPFKYSLETNTKGIVREWPICTQWGYGLDNSLRCVASACGPDTLPYSYRMRAECPEGWTFQSQGGQPRCDCPAGQELARTASGQWQCVPICAASVDNPSCYRNDQSCQAGNPILPGVAAKVQTEVDYQGAGTHPLEFKRSFRSNGARPYLAPGAWSHWVHNWGGRIETHPEPGSPTSRAYVIRGDASQLIYTTAGTGIWTAHQLGDRNRLTEQRDATTGARTGFVYRPWTDDSVEYYDPSGRLLRVAQRNGWTTTLTYSSAATPASVAPFAGLLISVKNQFGRELKFNYDAAGRLAELLPPGAVSGSPPGSPASPIRYAHNEPASLGGGAAAAGQLTSVTWQDGAKRRYHYEHASQHGLLTGITDELGVRIGTYSYTGAGRATRTEGPEGTRAVDIVHYGDHTDVIDRSGPTPVTSTYRWQTVQGLIRPSSVTAPCPQCGNSQATTAYAATGEVARSVGHDGRITFFTYDSLGRETERAVFGVTYQTATSRPALGLAEGVTSTAWHGTFNLPTQIAEPSKLSAFTYDSKGTLTGQSWTATTDATGAAKFAAVKTGSTFATGWGYNRNILATSVVETTNSVETGRWTLAYDALGNVTRTTHAASGAVSTVTTYDVHGRMLTGRYDSGATVSLQYSSRGLITGKTVGAESIAFVQNAIGLTTEVRMPDNQILGYVYDTDHKLTDVRLNGASITPTMLAASDYPDTPDRALVARTKALFERGISAPISPAHAQPTTAARRRVVPVPGGAMPGQPEFDPRTDMMSVAPMSNFDNAARLLAERFARSCECKPDGGYDRPTFTFVTFAHVLFSGHLSQRFSDKSYFAPTEKVGQALVDEVMARGREMVQPDPSRVVVDAELVRPLGPVGYARTTTGTFRLTNKVRLIYERNHCETRFRAGKEVVTMYPIE